MQENGKNMLILEMSALVIILRKTDTDDRQQQPWEFLRGSWMSMIKKKKSGRFQLTGMTA